MSMQYISSDPELSDAVTSLKKRLNTDNCRAAAYEVSNLNIKSIFKTSIFMTQAYFYAVSFTI